MFKRNHVCAIAAMAAFSMMSFIACGDDVVNTPNPSTEPVADEPSADSVSTKGPSAEEIQKNCQREGLNELCLVVLSPGKVEYFQSGMDINDALKEKMSNHFAGTDISIYVSVDSAGDSWTEKRCNAQNEYKFSRLGYYYRNERFLKHLSFQCYEGRWENVKDVSDRCSENPELGDICDLGTFCIQNAHSCTPFDDRNVYTSLGWISLPTYYGPFPTKGLLNPVTRFLTLVLDSDTDHPKYKYARYVYEGACADRKGGVCVEEWGWDGCDVDRGQNCVEIFRIYIKSNGEFDEERSFFSTEQKVNKLKEKPITETCDAASGGKLATVVDSLVFPNGQVFKQELQYQCDSESEKWCGVKQDVSACEKPDAKVGDVCPITDSGHVPLGGPNLLICYVYTENGWKEKGSDDWYAFGQESSCEEILNAPKIETECSWHDKPKKTVDGVTYSYYCEGGEWLVWDIQRLEYADPAETPADSVIIAEQFV